MTRNTVVAMLWLVGLVIVGFPTAVVLAVVYLLYLLWVMRSLYALMAWLGVV